LIVGCDSCGTVVDLDLSVKPRDPEASIRVALRDVQCVGEKFRAYWNVPSVAPAMRDILKAWDIWAVFAIAVVAVILAVVFDQSPLYSH
jgi:hypothetical protein